MEGNEVLIVDSFFTGTKRNLDHLLSNPSIEVMRHDGAFPLYEETEQIYNLAFPASPVHYQYDQKQSQPNIELAQAMLGWEPKINLEDGLKEAITCLKRIVS